jgi:hypothetical protein
MSHPAKLLLGSEAGRTCRLKDAKQQTENLSLTLAGLEKVWISPAKTLVRSAFALSYGGQETSISTTERRLRIPSHQVYDVQERLN